MIYPRQSLRPATSAADPGLSRLALGGLSAQRGLALAVMVAYVAVVLAIGASRSHVGYHETDYVEFFVPDAQRFLAGAPLQGIFHPPLYPMVVGSAYALLGDWLSAGIAVSGLAGLAGLVCSYLLFLRLGGPPAACGAVLTLLGSIFVGESVRAAADVMFFALFMGSCLLALEALSVGSRRYWIGCGLVVGLAMLTRTNAPPLLLLALAPFLGSGSRQTKVTNCLSVCAGIGLPIIIILAYGAAYDSQVFPANNHLSLATSYFSEGADRNSIDAALRVAGRFDSVTEVLLHDPAHIATTYVRDLWQTVSADLTMVVEPPLLFMFLPGVFLLLAGHWSVGLGLVLAVATAEVLLTNFKQFHPRYYLFLIPFIGAGVGQTCWHILHSEWSSRWRTTFGSVIVLMFAIPIGVAFAKAFQGTQNGIVELAELIPAADGQVERTSVIVARKPHLAFYAGGAHVHLPDFATLEQLQAFLQDRAAQGPSYLLYGEIEQRLRPQYQALREADGAPAWLEVVAESRRQGGWVLYRYRPPPIN